MDGKSDKMKSNQSILSITHAVNQQCYGIDGSPGIQDFIFEM
jgi:hypothetical protein